MRSLLLAATVMIVPYVAASPALKGRDALEKEIRRLRNSPAASRAVASRPMVLNLRFQGLDISDQG